VTLRYEMFGLQITGPINCLGYLHAASHYSLFTPAFVTCSTNAREGLVKLVTRNDVSGRWVDVWKSGTFLEKPQVSVHDTDRNHRPLSGRHQAVSVSFPWFRRPYRSCKEGMRAHLLAACPGMCHLSTCPPVTRHTIARDEYYHTTPHISTASNKCWG